MATEFNTAPADKAHPTLSDADLVRWTRRAISDLEDDVTAVRDFAAIVGFLGCRVEEIDPSLGNAICRCSREIQALWGSIESTRGELLDALHARRGEPEKELAA